MFTLNFTEIFCFREYVHNGKKTSDCVQAVYSTAYSSDMNINSFALIILLKDQSNFVNKNMVNNEMQI